MKLLLNVLVPTIYEFIGPESMDSVVFITYPDLTPGSEELRKMYEDSDLWRGSRCMGINFKEILESNGYDIDEYTRDCSYTLSSEAAKALLSDLHNYPEVTLITGEEPDLSCMTNKVTVYEFIKKSDKSSILLMNPVFEKLEMEVLPCISYGTYELEAPEGAADYYTSDSLYVIHNSQFQEILQGFPRAPQELRDLGFKEGHHILRWEGILHEDDPEIKRPWRDKLESMKKRIDQVLDSKTCVFLKNKRIRNIIKHYYGNI